MNVNVFKFNFYLKVLRINRSPIQQISEKALNCFIQLQKFINGKRCTAEPITLPCKALGVNTSYTCEFDIAVQSKFKKKEIHRQVYYQKRLTPTLLQPPFR